VDVALLKLKGNTDMSDLNTVDQQRRRRPRKTLIIDGRTWKPRSEIATVDLETTDRTLQSKNYRTIYHGGVAYCCLEEILEEIAAGAKRKNEPAKHRRSRG
jgi:hypothetical protein